MQDIKCRWAPSLGALEGTAEEVWGTTPYNPDADGEKPCVFFGLYGLPDFYALWRHKGKRWILWAGSDILHFKNGYWLDGEGKIRLNRKSLAKWISKNCESWVETGKEYNDLLKLGIKAKICPSFMGDVSKYEITFQKTPNVRVYASVSGDNFVDYGWDVIEDVAGKVRDVEFHLYGNIKKWKTKHSNVIVHGRVPKEQMNEEIKTMQAGLRLNKNDGFSEIVAKSALWGQYPISYYPHPHIGGLAGGGISIKRELVKALNRLSIKRDPNYQARNWYLKNFNNFPWNTKK